MPAKVMKAAAIAGLITIVCAANASGHVQTSLDEDDSPGGLDLVAGRQRDRVYFIATSHPATTSRHTEIVLKLVTYESWQTLGGSLGMTFVAFEFDMDRDGELDRCIKIGADGTMKAHMYRNLRGCALNVEESRIGSRRTRRPDDHSIKVIIPKRWLGRGLKSYTWRAVTSFEEEGHPDCPPPDPRPPERQYGTCLDVTRWAKHNF